MHEPPQHATAPLDDFADRFAELAEALATFARPARPRADRQPLRAAALAAVSMRPRMRELSLSAAFAPAGAITGVVLLP